MRFFNARVIARWVHIVCAIPILGYIYGAAPDVQQYAPAVRFGFFPAMVLTGLWMWKGHLVRRLVAQRAA